MNTSVPQPTINVLCVDDHPLVREGISGLISDSSDIRLVAEASNGIEALEMFRKWSPDVTLMDLKMPGMNGIDAIKSILTQRVDAKIIVLTTYEGDAIAQRALKAGAWAYLLKSDVRKGLLDAIRVVYTANSKLFGESVGQSPGQIQDDPLTSRELAVLELISAGKTNREIGEHLFLAEGTVKNHVKIILAKLRANDRTHAVVMGLERGIIGV